MAVVAKKSGRGREWMRGAVRGEYLNVDAERVAEGASDHRNAGWTSFDDTEFETACVGHKIDKSGRRGKKPTSKIG